ncbi:MAG: glucoamylase family protein [Bacteroidota bacterium]
MRHLLLLMLTICICLSCNTEKQPAEEEVKTEDEWWNESDDQLLDSVQYYTFKYFYDFAHPVSGMGRERSHSPFHGKENNAYDTKETVTIGGTGFGMMTFPVAVERGWISRTDAAAHLLKLTNWLYNDAERFKGMFSHWYEGSTGKTFAFSAKDNGGDVVESAFLFQGLLTVRQYFDGQDSTEIKLRDNVTKLWEEADWDFYRNNNPWILWHWSPEFEFEKNMPVMGFDETHIIYILAASSPTHPVDPSIYDTGWAIDSNNRFKDYGDYVQRLKVENREDGGGPLFFTHYSYLGMTPYFKDKYVNQAGYEDYFQHNRAMALANKEWCEKAGYPENCWGLTSSDDPFGYSSHAPGKRDNGTITPTAAISSIPYTPQESMAAMRYFLNNHKDQLWGPYGFYDSFSLKEKYFAPSYLAIDQGPIPVMIENYRTGLLWNLFLQDEDIQNGIKKLNFELTKAL